MFRWKKKQTPSAEDTGTGRTLSDEDIPELWDGLPPSDGGGLQGHDRYDKENGSVRLGLGSDYFESDGPSNSMGAGYRLNKGDD